MKKTPMSQSHEKRSAKMVEFAGWWMPIQYTGIKEEHLHVRKHVGLFDVSHMGEIRVKGPKSLETLQWLTTNDVAKLGAGEAQYSLLPNAKGGLVDDIIVYCLEPNIDYLVCVNAANEEKDWLWMQENNRGAELSNESSQWGQIAVQGPQAFALLEKLSGQDWSQRKPFSCFWWTFQNAKCLVALTGYTGETGAEVFVPWKNADALWTALLDAEGDFSVQPIGLGARDTLRTEMKYSLYGHEIDDVINPLEAGLGWVIKASQKDFIGKSMIMKAKEAGLKRSLIGFKMLEKGIPRQGYRLMSADGTREVGVCTSGTLSPSLNEAIGIGFIEAALAQNDQEFFVDIRGKMHPAKRVPTPFVRK